MEFLNRKGTPVTFDLHLGDLSNTVVACTTGRGMSINPFASATEEKDLSMAASQIAVVRQKSTGLYLRMTKFDPVTQAPLYGPLETAWLADSAPQAIAQAGFLGEDDHEPVSVTFATSDLSQLQHVSPEAAVLVLSNTNTRVAFKQPN